MKMQPKYFNLTDMTRIKKCLGFVLLLLPLALVSCNKTVIIKSGDLKLEYDNRMYSKVNSLNDNTSSFDNSFRLTEYLVTKNFSSDKFSLEEVTSRPVSDKRGEGTETILKGKYSLDQVSLQKIISIKTFENFPGIAAMNISYVNKGKQDLRVKQWVNNNYRLITKNDSPDFWTFQGSSSEARADWLLPITPGFYQKNYLGMNQSDYGGGIPVTDIWRKDGGLSVGHLEMLPKEVSLPVDYDEYSDYASVGIEKEFDDPLELSVGDTLSTFETFVSVHTGDYFASLRLFSELMQAKGIQFAESEEQSYESIWCGWGYERKFTVENIIATLPKVKELGIKWAVIDDGFQIAEGDWRVDTKRFPGGSKDMKRMVDAIHSYGLKAKLWWAPLAADPGSIVIKENPDILLINKDGAPQFITWWNSFYMSPASEATLKHTRETVNMFLSDWGFDGLKMDGQHMNAVPPDYNWKRDLEYPEKSIEMLPQFFNMVYKEARQIKPHAVIENCPCGTCMSFYNMPYTNQTVSSDPTSSWQIRLKGKTYKAIMPHTAYYGDHVELSDGGADFASSFGVGAVLGTKFTWPKDNPTQEQSELLTTEKERIWKKWFSMYDKMLLSKEKYLGTLYDIGFDKPETHVIAKNDTMYYAFYSPDWQGKIELRGLNPAVNYTAFDYENNKVISSLSGDKPYIETAFKNHLLIAVYKN